MTDPLLGNVLRLRAKAKMVAHTRVRTPFRHRRKAIKLTKEEREARQKVRDETRAKFHAALTEGRHTVMGVAEKLAEEFPGHDKDYYYRHLMQLPKLSEARRPITEWQAYLHIELKRRNKEIVELQGEEARRDRVSAAVVREIAEEWAKLTPEERTAITAETVKELEERRENRLEGTHNTQLAACHDACATLKKLKTEIENLHARTGLAILFVATRGDIDAFGNPVVYHSDDRVKHFMESTTGATLEDIAIRLEAYCIAGLEGVVGNQLTRTLELKAKLRGLILSKLQSTCKRGAIKRMNYNNFEGAITEKFGIVLENWPIPKFQNPSSMSHTEAEISFRAWESGTTRFRMLTNEEWADWLNARYVAPCTTESTPIAEPGTLPSTPAAASVPPVVAPPPPTVCSSAAAAAHPPTEAPASTTTPAETPAATAPASTTMPAETPAATAPAQTPPAEKRTADDAGLTAPPAKRTHVEPMTINFVNSVTPAVGAAFVVPKATRKKRSDAGVARGPRKQRAQPASENAAPAETTTSVAVPKRRPHKKQPAPQEAPAADAGPSS